MAEEKESPVKADKESPVKADVDMRLATFDHEIGDFKYKLPKSPDTKYVVDDSSFIPMSEAVKQLGTTPFDGDAYKSYYDFADGKDSGIAIPVSRTKDGKDIAEISSNIMEEVNNIADKVEKEKKFQQFKSEVAAKTLGSESTKE